MEEKKFEFRYKVYSDANELKAQDQLLLAEAKRATGHAYAPYSHFYVGAAALLINGQVVLGSNQENASFPVGMCAERVLLSTLSSLFPNMAIEAIAISYKSDQVVSDHPIAPCGICRQTLQEFEGRVKKPIRIFLGGQEGPVYEIESASHLLPLAFTSEELL
ncbi:MAG TPA: cytidine deaminase [Chitinophagaceae bacterium]|nr:cytidine deaminase [Chitinophagaceae bacterium]